MAVLFTIQLQAQSFDFECGPEPQGWIFDGEYAFNGPFHLTLEGQEYQLRALPIDIFPGGFSGLLNTKAELDAVEDTILRIYSSNVSHSVQNYRTYFRFHVHEKMENGQFEDVGLFLPIVIVTDRASDATFHQFLFASYYHPNAGSLNGIYETPEELYAFLRQLYALL